MASRVWGSLRLVGDLSDGLCVGHPDPDIWFDSSRKDEAQAICVECPAIKSCHLAAVTAREQHGIWGGADAHERGTPPAFRY